MTAPSPPSRRRARILSVVWLALMTIVWLVTLPSLRVTTSITHFLPDAADKRAAELVRALADGDRTGTLVLDLSGDTAERLSETATRLVASLGALPETKSVTSGVDEAAQQSVFALLAERPPTALLGPEDFEDEAIRARLGKLKERLASPLGPFVRQLAPRDPLGGIVDAFERVSADGEGRLVSRDGVLFSADGAHAFMFVVTRASAFDAPKQRAYFEQLERAFEDARTSPSIRLETSGVAKMTIASERQIRGDIERIGGLSTAGILLLFGVLFGSFRMMGLGLVPLWFGSAAATVVTHLVFGEIHGLTLAFGTSLLGVGIDYAEHYFSHYTLEAHRGAEPVMRGIWPGLWMGALTTIVGFVAMGASGFPGVRQIALFSSVAIVFALVGTRWLLPPWMPEGHRPSWAMAALERGALRVTRAAGSARWVMLASGLVALGLLLGLARVRFVDDPSALLALDAELLAEDARVRDRVSPSDPGRFVVVVRPDAEEAMTALERTTRALGTARRDGLLDGATEVTALVASRARQEASFRRAKERRARIEELLREEGFVPEAFAPFFRELDAEAPRLLTLEELRASPLAAMLAPLAPRLPQGQAFVLPVKGVRDVAALGARLPDALVIDEPTMLESAYRDVRKKTMGTLGVGLALVLLTLTLRYRTPRVVAAAFVPAVLGAVGAASLVSALGTPLGLLHLVALLLVSSMGVDYGIFVVEGRGSEAERASSLVSIVTATSTTLLSFGLLGLSPNPALRALGVTITLGLVLTTLLCPLALALIGKEARR